MNSETRRTEIERHRKAILALEAEAAGTGSADAWPPSGFYLLWHVLLGMLLGALAALISLVANIAMAPLFGQRPLELIRVYLTFPMGERALVVEEGILLFVGCLLYLVTGALFGILCHLVLVIFFDKASSGKKLLVATALGLLLWIVNFYLLLSWLQPLLLGGNWIVSLVPAWVGALTHLAFAWSLWAMEILGGFRADRDTRAARDSEGR